MKTPPNRLRHPAWLIWLLGGLLGTGINIVVTILLMQQLSPPLALFVGTLANQLFHFVYYRLVYVNEEIRFRTSAALQVVVYVVVAACAACVLYVLLRWMEPLPAVMLVLVVLTTLNSLLVRLQTFSSAELAMVEYEQVGETFYVDQTDPTKVNFLRARYHRSRFAALTRFVEKYCTPDALIVDLGCGNCMWNTHGLRVVGVDCNEPMLRWARDERRLVDYHVTTDLSRTGLPDGAFDAAVASEVLEHLIDFDKTIHEVRRILKSDGTFLVTVPYDYFLGPFFVLFNINCLWQGYVRGSAYHRYRCGHVNHFTKTRLRNALESAGFSVRAIEVVNWMTLYAAATKRPQTSPVSSHHAASASV